MVYNQGNTGERNRTGGRMTYGNEPGDVIAQREFDKKINHGRRFMQVKTECICTADLTDWPVIPNPDCPRHGAWYRHGHKEEDANS